METKEIQKQTQQPVTLAGLLGKDAVKKRFEDILGAKSASFISSVISATKANAMLAGCDPNSIISSAVVAATLDLPIQNNLGFAAIVPYNESYQDGNGQWQKKAVAQFQMMWRGFVQLALRTGQYKTINATVVYQGELQKFNRVSGEVEIDESKRSGNEVIGYVAYFRLLNGFEKYLYMNVGEVRAHGEKFSKSFNNKNGMWQKDFNAMALKTVTKMILSKYGILSVEMQKAMTFDQAVVENVNEEKVIYPDSTEITEAVVVEDENIQQQGNANPSQSNLPNSNDL